MVGSYELAEDTWSQNGWSHQFVAELGLINIDCLCVLSVTRIFSASSLAHIFISLVFSAQVPHEY